MSKFNRLAMVENIYAFIGLFVDIGTLCFVDYVCGCIRRFVIRNNKNCWSVDWRMYGRYQGY